MTASSRRSYATAAPWAQNCLDADDRLQAFRHLYRKSRDCNTSRWFGQTNTLYITALHCADAAQDAERSDLLHSFVCSSEVRGTRLMAICCPLSFSTAIAAAEAQPCTATGQAAACARTHAAAGEVNCIRAVMSCRAVMSRRAGRDVTQSRLAVPKAPESPVQRAQLLVALRWHRLRVADVGRHRCA